MYMYTYICVYIYIYVYIHIYTYTLSRTPSWWRGVARSPCGMSGFGYRQVFLEDNKNVDNIQSIHKLTRT